MGVESGGLGTNIRPVILSAALSQAGLMYCGDFDGQKRPVQSYDGKNVCLIETAGWGRGERHLKIVQANSDGTKFRAGNLRLGVDSSIQWGAT